MTVGSEVMTPRLNFTDKTFDSKKLKNGKSFLLIRPSVLSSYLVKSKVSMIAIGFLRFELQFLGFWLVSSKFKAQK